MRFNKALVGGSLTLLLTFNLFNVLNFFFQFFMARLLTVAEYGVLAALFSIILIMAVPAESIQTIITRYTSIQTDKGKIKEILTKSLRKSLKFSLLVFAGYLILAMPLSYSLKIPYSVLGLTGLMIFAIFLNPVTRGVLQGRKKFGSLGFNVVADGAIKLLLGIFFVLLVTNYGLTNYRVHGAMLATVIGASAAFALSFIALRDITNSKQRKTKVAGIYSYAKPVLVASSVIFVFFSLDVLLAKILFEPEAAGSYAISSIIGKTIFLVTSPISKAMFSLAATNKKHQNSRKILLQSMFIVLGISLIAILFFSLFPDLIVKIFSGDYLPTSAGILIYIGISAALLSLTNLILFYKLSSGNMKRYFVLPIFLIIEIALMTLFSQNLMNFSIAFVVSSGIFLLGAIILFRKKNETVYNHTGIQ